MKRVFLYAYDRKNLGDDLFVHTICRRYPQVQFYMWSNPENRETFRILSNLQVVDPESALVHFLRSIRPSLVARYRSYLEKRCDAVVYIGGSIFIEYDIWEQLLTWWEYEAQNRPFYVLGANFGPYKTEAYRDKLAEIFAQMKDVCFRDSYSRQKFAQVPTIRQAPDILFALTMPQRRRFERRVFFSVVDCKERSEGINRFDSFEARYLSFMCRLIETAVEGGYIPVLASFCKAEGDEIAIGKLKERLNGPALEAVETLCYSGTNSAQMLQAIADSDFVVASRFHAAILGFDAEKPVLPVVYSDKTLHVLEDTGFGGRVLDLRDLEGQELDFAEMLKQPQGQRLFETAQLRTEAGRHFAKLDEAMEK